MELISPHARLDAFHTVLLLINSRTLTNDLAQAVIQANIMKNLGIKIVPIAVGRDVLLDELRKMATNPSDVDYIEFSQIGRSENLVRQIQQSLCPIPREYSDPKAHRESKTATLNLRPYFRQLSTNFFRIFFYRQSPQTICQKMGVSFHRDRR